MSKKRRAHSPALKAKVALAAIQGEKTITELAEQFQIHPNQITNWKKQLLNSAQEIFENGSSKSTSDNSATIKELHAKIGKLTVEKDFLSKSARSRTMTERKAMVDKSHKLPINRQCQLLELSRSSFYYRGREVSESELQQMRQIDEIHTQRPFYGSRRIRDWFEDQGISVNRKRIQRLMRLMGIQALYPKKKTSRPGKGHKVYPYLLTGLDINGSNQVWAADITYIPMAKGFLYLVAIMDWHSRKVLSWRLSNTMDDYFCLEALNEALQCYGKPEIFNTDQGAQFTSMDFTDILKQHDIAISMDGKGRWMDNIFIERLWRSLKYEEVYLKAYQGVAEARQGIQSWLQFYNSERRHQGLRRQTPDSAFFAGLKWKKVA
ncbi:MAG: IS3 family transposase [Gammaproteobacteria bacterium]